MIEYAEISGIKVLHFIQHELAEEQGFKVVLVGLQNEVKLQLDKFAGSSDAEETHQGRRQIHMNDALREIEDSFFEEHRGNSALTSKGTAKNPDLDLVKSFVSGVV